MSAINEPILVDADGAAALLGVPVAFIREHSEHLLPRVVLGARTIRYRPESLREFAAMKEAWPDEALRLRAAKRMGER